jgi:hypothetical protein
MVNTTVYAKIVNNFDTLVRLVFHAWKDTRNQVKRKDPDWRKILYPIIDKDFISEYLKCSNKWRRKGSSFEKQTKDRNMVFIKAEIPIPMTKTQKSLSLNFVVQILKWDTISKQPAWIYDIKWGSNRKFPWLLVAVRIQSSTSGGQFGTT